jgi:hypothetical protein
MPASADLCTAAEQLFFQGAPLAHVVAYEERMRESRRQKASDLAQRWRRPSRSF